MINYAHRGASEKAPENTFSAFYLGLELGANGIETDIQKTKDDVLVLFHDASLKRITGIDRPIQACRYGDLMSLDFGRYKDDRYKNEKIVSLSDFLKYFSGRPIHLALELKQNGIEQDVLNLVYAYHCKEQTIVTSFFLSHLENMRRLDETIALGYLVDQIDASVLNQLLSLKINQVCPKAASLSKAHVDSAHQRGLTVRAWGVKSIEDMTWAIKCGVDGMTVDFPDKLTSCLNSRYR